MEFALMICWFQGCRDVILLWRHQFQVIPHWIIRDSFKSKIRKQRNKLPEHTLKRNPSNNPVMHATVNDSPGKCRIRIMRIRSTTHFTSACALKKGVGPQVLPCEKNALLLEGERPVNARELKHCSYIKVKKHRERVPEKVRSRRPWKSY